MLKAIENQRAMDQIIDEMRAITQRLILDDPLPENDTPKNQRWRKARIFVPKATLRWWRLFLQDHYPKRKPGRPPKDPPTVTASGA